jgi:putative ABC transport system permease protein
VLGVFPGGYLLLAAIITITGGDSARATLPAPWQLISLILAAALTVAALTAVPAHLGGRRPVTETL